MIDTRNQFIEQKDKQSFYGVFYGVVFNETRLVEVEA